MQSIKKNVNLAMSGGGVKGIAYIGVFDEAELRGYKFGNIAGVSAGALAGALAGAGCNVREMWKAMEAFDFNEVQMVNIEKKLPVVTRYMEYIKRHRTYNASSIERFLTQDISDIESERFGFVGETQDPIGNMLKNIAVFSKYGSLFDGDYLEEWLSDILKKKGVRTFGDLRGGKVDNVNPRGYKVRMTGVDCNRAKLVVLPDDMAYYGVDPDDFEVAKAVRISTCVPFAFKPVVIEKKTGSLVKRYNLVDGGVFDRFPFWLIDGSKRPTLGFKLSGGKKKKFFSIDTALDVLKSLISAVQDIGMPKDIDESSIKYIGEIDTSKVSFLDFSLSKEDKDYLYNAGKQSAIRLFDRFEQRIVFYRRRFFPLFRRMF